MSFLAGCMAALGLFILVLMLILLILDVRESNDQARYHQRMNRLIIRDLQRKEDREDTAA